MQNYSDVTPTIQLLDLTTDLDVFNSSYVNMRFGVLPAQVITIDSKYQANLPGLAFDFYGDQKYWRAILCFNGLVDPINDIVVGVKIGLPDPTSLEAFMAQGNKSLTEPLNV
jgi:hypothetical protein